MERKIHQIDANGQIAGRLASRIAILLQGKNKAIYQSHVDCGDYVEVTNIKGIKFSRNKLDSKVYHRTTMYPGGIRTTKLRDLMASNPSEVLRKTIHDMLPKNKLRPKMLKRLTIS